MMDDQVTTTPKRKDDHLRICIEEDVKATVSPGFDSISLTVEALPDLDFDKIDTSQTVFGKKLTAPILISSMTGGSGKTKYFNQLLAQAAEHYQIAMGVGSQRAAIEHPELVETFAVVRKQAPKALLFANLGVAQLNEGYGVNECQLAIDMLEADGLYLHLNALQEALQPEGNANFRQLLPKIERIVKKLEVPVLVKEVGCGISAETAKRLLEIGVRGIDVAGLGGTSWAAVEMYRQSDPVWKQACSSYRNWGIPTVSSLRGISDLSKDVVLISSGGLENGLDIAKSLALGANLAGFARKLIIAVNESECKLSQTIDQLILELRIAMFVTGSATIQDLKGKWYEKGKA